MTTRSATTSSSRGRTWVNVGAVARSSGLMWWTVRASAQIGAPWGQVYGPGSADPVSQLMLHLLGALAEFERALIHERQAEGIAVAKKQGRYRGRKPALSEGQLARARRLVAEGVPKTKVAAQLGVGRSTLYRALRS